MDKNLVRDKSVSELGADLLLKLKVNHVDLVKKIMLNFDYIKIRELVDKYEQLRSIYEDTYFWRTKITLSFPKKKITENDVKKLRAIYLRSTAIELREKAEEIRMSYETDVEYLKNRELRQKLDSDWNNKNLKDYTQSERKKLVSDYKHKCHELTNLDGKVIEDCEKKAEEISSKAQHYFKEANKEDPYIAEKRLINIYIKDLEPIFEEILERCNMDAYKLNGLLNDKELFVGDLKPQYLLAFRKEGSRDTRLPLFLVYISESANELESAISRPLYKPVLDTDLPLILDTSLKEFIRQYDIKFSIITEAEYINQQEEEDNKGNEGARDNSDQE